jgi:MFS family permease
LATLIALTLPKTTSAPNPSSKGATVFAVLARIWRPGLVLAFATLPTAAMSGFITLAFEARAWHGAGAALLAFSAAFITVRLVGARLILRYGLMTVSRISCMILLAGQLSLFLATSQWLSVLGAIASGIGYSLVFPAMGIISMNALPVQFKGRVIGLYSAFFDGSLAITGPIVGMLVAKFDADMIYLFGAFGAPSSLGLLLSIHYHDSNRNP